MKVDFVPPRVVRLRSAVDHHHRFAHFLSDPVTGPLSRSRRISRLHHRLDNALLAIINNILDLATIDPARCRSAWARRHPQDHRSRRRRHPDRLATDPIELKVDVDPNIGNFMGDERRWCKAV